MKSLFPAYHSGFSGRNMKRWVLLIAGSLAGSVCFANFLLNVSFRTHLRGGFVDCYGIWKIAPTFDEVTPFSEGLAAVCVGGKWGFIDTTGQYVIAPQFDEARSFHDGFAAVGGRGFRFKWGFVDRFGKIAIKPQFSAVQDFSEGCAGIWDEKVQRWSFIDRSAHILMPPKYKLVRPFSEGLACVQIGEKFGFIDRNGKLVIDTRYNGASSFHDGIAVISMGKHKEGMPWEPAFPFVSSETICGDCKLSWFDGKIGFIDKSGERIVNRDFDTAVSTLSEYYVDDGEQPFGRFSEGLAPVKVGKVSTFINSRGEKLNCAFDATRAFRGGLAPVKIKDLWGFVDRKGTLKIPARYQFVHQFSNDYALVETERNELKYIDATGKVVSTGTIHSASSLSCNLSAAYMIDTSPVGWKNPTSVGHFIDDASHGYFDYCLKDVDNCIQEIKYAISID